jgi:hypothetical protein
MKIYVNAAEQQSRWYKEFEMKRTNVTPLEFWRLVKKMMKGHNEDLADWIEHFDQWAKPAPPVSYHEIKHEDFTEASKNLPYDFQVYDSRDYNVILEFDFFNIRKGYGYFYFASNQKRGEYD